MPPPETSLLLRVIDTHVTALRDEMVAMRQASEDRHVEIMKLIEQGFPDGDLKSHHRYHMALIEQAASRKAIKLEVIKKLVSGSIWSGLAYLAYEAFKWVSSHVKL